MTCYWDDDFTGTLTDNWVDISYGNGSAQIVGEKLHLDTGAAGVSSGGAVQSKAVISGDFQLKYTIATATYPYTNYWWSRGRFYIDSTHFVELGFWTRSAVLQPWIYTYGYNGTIYSQYIYRGFEATPYWFKIIRSGSNISVYYSLTDPAGYVQLSSTFAIGSGDGQLFFETVNSSAYPSVASDFDNLTFVAGCPALPSVDPVAPTVITEPVINITNNSATLYANVTDDGGATVTERGFVWGTSSVDLNNTEIVLGTTGEYSINIFNLEPATTYYVNGFAINSVGTAYGSVIHFITLQTSETHTDIETNEPPETGPPPMPPANMWTDIVEIIRYYLRDPDGQIFTDAELMQYYNDAQFEIAVKSGPVIRVEAHYFPPEYDGSYMWDWESDFGEGTQYQCLTINQADGWVICYPWEAAYWLDVEPSQDDGYRDFHPWEMCLGSAADVIRVPLHKKFHKMLYCAFDELTLDPIDEKRLAEQDAFYRSRTGEAVNYYRPDEIKNEIVIYPLPSNIWDETEVYEVLGDAGGMISDESWLDLRDLGITYDVVPTDGMLVEVYEAMPDELTGWDDIPDLPPYVVKYARYGALERAYGADTDAFIPSLRDYWAVRKKIGVEALKKWKRLSKVNRDYRLGGAMSRVQSRHPRLPEHYPRVT